MDQDTIKRINEIHHRFDKGYDWTKDHIRDEMFNDFEWLIELAKELTEKS